MEEMILNRIMKLADKAMKEDEVPVGCVIVKDGKIIGEGYNRTVGLNKTTAHAEIIAIEQANEALGSWRLEDCDLYVTLEPCDMCCGAIRTARIRNVYYLSENEKNITFKTKSLQIANKELNSKNTEMLKTFFKKKRG